MAEITARYHYSDDTLLSMGSYTFEGGKTLQPDGRYRQWGLPPSQ